jgi:hypothetical protein
MHGFISGLLGTQATQVLVEHVDQVLDYKTWLETMKAQPVANISKPLLFRMKKEDRQEGRTLVYARKYMRTSKQEEPDCYEPDQGILLVGPERLQRLPLLANAVSKIPLDHGHASKSESMLLYLVQRVFLVDDVHCVARFIVKGGKVISMMHP